LYDLRADPNETINLAANARFQKQREALTRYTNSWRQALRAWKPEQAWADPVSEQDLVRDGLS
jgi:hypothetical protein